MDMKKFLQAVDGASTTKPVEGSNDMKQFMQIVEGRGPLNRLTAAESMAMQSSTKKKSITNPVLNVEESAKPSMIGKYFKTVETELAEANEHSKNRARNLAERVTNKMEAASPAQQAAIAVAMKKAGKKPKTAKESKDELAEELNKLFELRNQIEEAIKQRLDPKCWKGKKIGNPKTKIKGGVRVNNCVPAQEDLRDPADNPCWTGYKPVGTKKKNGKTVPNCVPKEDTQKTGTAGQLRGTDKVDVKGTVLGSPEKSQKGLRNKLVGGGA